MLIEAYGKGAALPWLVETYPAQFLSDLLHQTVELRRDPKEREEEIRAEENQRWLEANKSRTLVAKTATGTKEINLSRFTWSDDD